jgi:hypothetical protein
VLRSLVKMKLFIIQDLLGEQWLNVLQVEAVAAKVAEEAYVPFHSFCYFIVIKWI